jgi:hypothetical protein
MNHKPGFAGAFIDADSQGGTMLDQSISPKEAIEKRILQAIKGLNYGSVEIMIHDAKVVQIERKERFRFDRKS